MTWEQIRRNFPHQWLLLEAMEAYSEHGKRRHKKTFSIIFLVLFIFHFSISS